MQVNSRDILNYWIKLSNGLSENDLIDLLNMIFETKNIEEIYTKKFEEYSIQNKKIHEFNNYKSNKDVKQLFFKNEISEFKTKISNSINQCPLIKNKEAFLNLQVNYLSDKIHQETRLFFLNELINFYDNKPKDFNSMDEKIKIFINEKFNTQSFRKECEIYYPELIRLLDVLVTSNVNYLTEILLNLENDIQEIENLILNHKVEEIKNIKFGEGDTHSKGKSVTEVVLDKGKIIYKPRKIDIEKKFYDFIQHIEVKSDYKLANLGKIRSISKQNYSYVEFIEHKKAKDLYEIEKFYKNLGETLCLLYILNGTDMHSENIIAKGITPYLIDLETLFHSYIFIDDSIIGDSIIGDEYFETLLSKSNSTVMSIGILPGKIVKNIDDKDYALEIGGIGGEEKNLSPFKYVDLNMNENGRLEVIKKFMLSEINNNNPIEKFDSVTFESSLKNIKVGFENMYLWVCDNKDYVQSLIRELFTGEKTRVVLRPTFSYSKLLSISKEPHFLNSYINRKVLFSKLGLNSKNYINIAKSEVKQLLDNDIPIFYSYTDSKYLFDYNNNKIQLFSKEAPIDKVIRKIDMMCENGLEKELCYIDQTMNLKKYNLKSDITNIKFNENFINKNINKSEYLNTAKNIGDLILRRKIEIKGTTSWISTSLLGKDEIEFGVSPVGSDLYLGNAGIYLFLAYLGKYTGDKKYLDESKRAIRFNINFLKQSKLYKHANIGLFNGIGGELLSLGLVSKIIDIEDCEEVIKFALDNLKELVRRDLSYDILGGASGLISSLIELLKIFPQFKDDITKLLEISYNHIIENRIICDDYCYWKSKVAVPYTGYAHGNAGIVSALIKLKYNEKHLLNKNLVSDKIINEILNYQRNLYSNEYKNWKISNVKDSYSNGWCHGAPGILLSSCNLLKYGYKDSHIEEELNTALETTIKYGFGNNPTYCHGDLGNLEIINEFAKFKNDDELKRKCKATYIDLYENVISQKWDTHIFRNTESLGLMLGLAGWGYSILRFLYEDELLNFIVL